MKGLDRIYCLFDPAGVGTNITQQLTLIEGQLQWRLFPDGETYVRILDECKGQHVAIFAQLDDPDRKLTGLIFAATQLKAMGAASVGLIAPYLPYLRHDIRFHEGEALSSQIVSQCLDQQFDWLMTVDPHLHRINGLNELYKIPSCAVSAMPAIADWIAQQVWQPCFIGPDAESEQWVRPLAEALNAPYLVLHKDRQGDREVDVGFAANTTAADQGELIQRIQAGGLKPVLVDDILSTGMTIKQAARHLADLGLPQPICLVVHALFADHQQDKQDLSGSPSVSARTLDGLVEAVCSTNSVQHHSNEIGIESVITEAISAFVPSLNSE